MKKSSLNDHIPHSLLRFIGVDFHGASILEHVQLSQLGCGFWGALEVGDPVVDRPGEHRQSIGLQMTPYLQPERMLLGAVAGQLAVVQRVTGFDSRTEQLFVGSTDCCSGSGCHVYVNLNVCKRTHDTEENPKCGAKFYKKKIKLKEILIECTYFLAFFIYVPQPIESTLYSTQCSCLINQLHFYKRGGQTRRILGHVKWSEHQLESRVL
ncbi:hypothetical protein SFRURICE_015540 [Spodoptera frugiperda]|nr:hypothetical protein SFRURICE_015540 [Spodoptera frugiperda]